VLVQQEEVRHGREAGPSNDAKAMAHTPAGIFRSLNVQVRFHSTTSTPESERGPALSILSTLYWGCFQNCSFFVLTDQPLPLSKSREIESWTTEESATRPANVRDATPFPRTPARAVAYTLV
jgi:hypothetical protein